MKNLIIDKLMNYITSEKELSDIKKEELRYGLSSIYITYSKLVVISLLALILGIFKEYIIFLLIYNIIRTFSFGLHATKSWMCWISSTIIFLIIPYIASVITIPQIIKVIVGSYIVARFAVNAPADTIKKPIISKKRRLFFKYVSTILSFLYILISIITKNNLISNVLFLATLVQTFVISPYTYRLFKLPYNNYKTYITE